MREDTLLNIKIELKKLLPVIRAYKKCFNRTNLITVEVIVGNMSGDARGTYGYSHYKAIEELRDYNKCLLEMAKYDEGDHFINWISQEVEMTITGNELSEE